MVEGTAGAFPSNTGTHGGQYAPAVPKSVPRSTHPSRCFMKKGFSDLISSENTPPDSLYNICDIFKILRSLSYW